MDKSNFIGSAIGDIQATIRAIDVKVGALIVLILAPFSSLGRVFGHIDNVCNGHQPYLWEIISILFLFFWFLALASLVCAISAIDNPADHIVNSEKQKGSFYGGGLYHFCIVDSLLNRVAIKASKDVATFCQTIPCTSQEIECELVFEQMKLIYIRDLKAHRLKWGVKFASVWLALGVLIFVSSRYIMPK